MMYLIRVGPECNSERMHAACCIGKRVYVCACVLNRATLNHWSNAM